MGIIQDIFTKYGPEYLRLHGRQISFEQLKVVQAIINCKTDTYGRSAYKCEKCASIHTVYHSCGNRHCPNCQYHKTLNWFDKQMHRHLPGPHFMLTFTVPRQLRWFMRRYRKQAYSALFLASSEAIKTLARDQRHIGGDLPGFFGVLHTWNRQLSYHPHIHYIAPAGAMNRKTDRWITAQNKFYLPVKALSTIFRAKLRDLLIENGLFDRVPPEVWTTDFNVHCKPVETVEPVLKYLAPYVFRVAISDSRIVKVEKDFVYFRYKKKNSRRFRIAKVHAFDFIERFLCHVLPTGFMKVRYYGFLNPASSVSIEKVATLIELANDFELKEIKADIAPSAQPVCNKCGGPLICFYKEYPGRRLLSG